MCRSRLFSLRNGMNWARLPKVAVLSRKIKSRRPCIGEVDLPYLRSHRVTKKRSPRIKKHGRLPFALAAHSTDGASGIHCTCRGIEKPVALRAFHPHALASLRLYLLGRSPLGLIITCCFSMEANQNRHRPGHTTDELGVAIAKAWL